MMNNIILAKTVLLISNDYIWTQNLTIEKSAACKSSKASFCSRDLRIYCNSGQIDYPFCRSISMVSDVDCTYCLLFLHEMEKHWLFGWQEAVPQIIWNRNNCCPSLDCILWSNKNRKCLCHPGLYGHRHTFHQPFGTIFLT